MIRTTLAAITLLALAGCGDDGSTMPDASGVDTGTPRDSGTRIDSGTPVDSGGGMMDSGPADPCATDDMPMSTVGCNGAPPGASVADNDFGGRCTGGGDMMPEGTCTGMDAVCAADMGMEGLCLKTCPAAATYVSTGGCPTGSRCFTLDPMSGFALCYPDCNTGADCVTGMCDGEGSCVPGGAPPGDAGMPDGGASDAGMPDAG